MVRLPAVEPPGQSPPGQLVSHPDSSAEILQAPGETDVAPASPPPTEPQLPPGVRNGVFQKVLFDATWLAPGGGDGLGINDLQLQGDLRAALSDAQLAAGDYARLRGALLSQGPQNVDLPPQLHEGYTQFRWLSQVTPQWGSTWPSRPASIAISTRTAARRSG